MGRHRQPRSLEKTPVDGPSNLHRRINDVIVASAKAYVAAINRILALKEGTQTDSKAAGSAA